MRLRVSAPSNGSLRQAIQSLYNTSTQGVDNGAFARLIQHCSDHCLLRQGKQVHARLVLFSVTPRNFLASKLITFYCKSNVFPDARHVFDQIPHKNVFSWNAMLIGYSLQNMYADALRLFSTLAASYSVDVKPDNYTLSCVLKAMSALLSDSRLAGEVHCYILRHGLESDLFVTNALITYYAKCDKMGLARSLFNRMPERDVVSWNSMIAGYSQGGFFNECKDLYKEMVDSPGLVPNGVTMVSVLQACGQTNDLIFGMEVHQFVIEKQIEIDLSLCNAIIGLYAKCGSLDYARELFEEMSEKDEVTYNSIISGYMVYGLVDRAMDLFRQMETPGLSTWNAVLSGLFQNNYHEAVIDLFREMLASGSRPNAVTISSILPTFSYFSYLKGGKELHAYVVRHNLDQNIYLATALIDTYAKSGCLHLAERVFNQSKGRSLIIWTAIISASAAHGDAYAACCLYNEMLNSGIQPDAVTFTALLTACCHSGQVEEAWNIFDSMQSKHGIEPSVEHYACMVGVLSRAGRLHDAADFISKMPMEPSAKVWGALLNGASVFGNVEMGKFACDHLFEMEPENTGSYIIMANLYSQAGKWKEADNIRERLKNIGLNKTPGMSWVETNKGIQNFIAKDVSSDNAGEVYEILEGLLKLMRGEGYVLQDELDEEIVLT